MERPGSSSEGAGQVKEQAFLNCFEDPFCPAALSFLEMYPTSVEARKLTLRELQAFFKGLHVHSDSYSIRVYKGLRSSLEARALLVETRSHLAQIIACQLLQIKGFIKSYEKRLEEASRQVEELRLLEGIKGIGLRSRVGILIYFYHYQWKDFREAQAAAGLSPATLQSGKYKFVHFRKGCIKWARDLFTELAYSTLLYQPWARLYYDRKRKEGKKHYHALRCVANIWVKILFKLWKEGTTYNHEKHFVAMTQQLVMRLVH
jgi:transposase